VVECQTRNFQAAVQISPCNLLKSTQPPTLSGLKNEQ